MEEWKDVDGFEGYQVSNEGRVRSIWKRGVGGRRDTFTIIAGGKTAQQGYHYVNLRRDKENFHKKIHHLVAEAFIGPRPVGLQVAHNDGDKNNNTVGNLRYATPKENAADKREHGTMNTTLTEAEVADIKLRMAAGQRIVDIHKDYPQVTDRALSAIKRGIAWGHVLPEVDTREATNGRNAAIVAELKAGARLVDVSTKYNLNIGYLSRMFKKATGQSLREYKR